MAAKKIGVVIPLEKQIEMTKQKWGENRTVVIDKSPYTIDKTWKEVANSLNEDTVEAVVQIVSDIP